MEHPFDRAAKGLSRRGFLNGVAVTAVSDIASKLRSSLSLGLGTRGAGPTLPQPNLAAEKNRCAVRSAPAHTTFSFADRTSYKGESLSLTGEFETLGYKFPKMQMSLRAELGTRTVLDVRGKVGHTVGGTKHERTPDVRISSSYETAAGRTSRSEILVRNGVIEGFVDGRGFTTPIAKSATELQLPYWTGLLQSGAIPDSPPQDLELASAIKALAVSATNDCSAAAHRISSNVGPRGNALLSELSMPRELTSLSTHAFEGGIAALRP